MGTSVFRLFIAVALGLLLWAPGALAAESSLGELQQRFKARLPEVQQLKAQGKVGETARGLLEMVKPAQASDGKVKQVMDEENADRQELYRALARQTGATPEDVAARNAARNFERARAGEWLKHADGVWRQK